MFEITKYQLLFILERLKDMSKTGTIQEVIDGYRESIIDTDAVVFRMEECGLEPEEDIECLDDEYEEEVNLSKGLIFQVNSIIKPDYLNEMHKLLLEQYHSGVILTNEYIKFVGTFDRANEDYAIKIEVPIEVEV